MSEAMSMPIGYQGLGLPYPVFFDPHYSILTNKPPVTLITGGPGSGKTYGSLLLAAYASVCGKTNFILDPKGDFLSLKILEDRGYIKDVSVWAIFDPKTGKVYEGNQGMLDPTCLYDDPGKNVNITIDAIKMMVGQMTDKQNNAVTPLVRDVVRDPEKASFHEVVRVLKQSQDEEVRAIGIKLEVIFSLEQSKLLAQPRKVVGGKQTEQEKITLKRGATIVASLLGLALPPENKSSLNYNNEEKASIVIMWLLTSYVLDAMMKTPTNMLKTLIIDEAWVLFATEVGRQMINQVALLGRSKNMATILITQSPQHIEPKEGDASLENTISTRISFRNSNEDDNFATVKAMRLPENEGWEREIPELAVGQALMKDASDKIGFVRIIAPAEFDDAFNTNPLKK